MMENEIKEAIRYMEAHLLDPITPSDVARHVHISPFHLHRIFKIVTQVTISEYLRNRRLSVAGVDVLNGEESLLDLALKYQYDSQEGFQKAFYRFHGVNPSKARQMKSRLKAYHPLKIHITFKGGHSMDYTIVKKEPFTLLCVKKAFPNSIIDEEDNTEIPKFWDKMLQEGTVKKLVELGQEKDVYGPCESLGKTSDSFYYGIGVPYEGPAPEGFDLWPITHPLYAVFTAKTKDDIGKTWKRIMEEFFPNNGYEMADAADFEVYRHEPTDYFCEIWVPIIET